MAALFWRPHGGRFQLFGGPGIESVEAEHQASPVTPVPLASAEMKMTANSHSGSAPATTFR